MCKILKENKSDGSLLLQHGPIINASDSINMYILLLGFFTQNENSLNKYLCSCFPIIVYYLRTKCLLDSNKCIISPIYSVYTSYNTYSCSAGDVSSHVHLVLYFEVTQSTWFAIGFHTACNGRTYFKLNDNKNAAKCKILLP